MEDGILRGIKERAGQCSVQGFISAERTEWHHTLAMFSFHGVPMAR
jgi:hypothetical protein